MTDDAIREAAHATGFRGGDIVRLGAHETVSVEGLPPDAVAIFAKGYDQGHGVAGPNCAVVLELTSDAKRRYDLPERPSFIEAYL